VQELYLLSPQAFMACGGTPLFFLLNSLQLKALHFERPPNDENIFHHSVFQDSIHAKKILT
jgi:hypothetical protein